MASSAFNDELDELLASLVDGELTGARFARLQDLLLENPDAQAYYRRYMRLCSLLEFELANAAAATTGEKAMGSITTPAIGPMPNDGSFVDMQVPPAVGPAYVPRFSPLSFDSSLGSFLISYGVSAVLVGIALLIFSMMASPEHHGDNIARPWYPSNPTHSGEGSEKPDSRPQIASIAQITGAVDCVCEDAKEPPAYDWIKLHDTFALKSGLLEITYHTGTRVILQGPCRYEVESDAGGFLRVGKVVARVEKRDAVVSDSPAPRPQSPLFTVRTPTAVVTDLGTEFGVEVSEKGRTQTQVFTGVVKVRSVAAAKSDEGKLLHAGEAARVSETGVLESAEIALVRDPFVRKMPQRKTIADIRFDYDRHVAGLRRGQGSDIPDAAAFGHWNYYGCDGVNPSKGNLIPLIWKTVGDVGMDGYGGEEDFATPALASTLLFKDGVNPKSDEISLHPGSAMSRAIVARWTAGDRIVDGATFHVCGTIRKSLDLKIKGSDGVQFLVYVNGVLRCDIPIAADDIEIHRFDLPALKLAAGETIDFVLDRKNEFVVDESLLSARIAVAWPAGAKTPFATPGEALRQKPVETKPPAGATGKKATNATKTPEGLEQ